MNTVRKMIPYYDYKVVCATTGKFLGWTRDYDARTAKYCWEAENYFRIRVNVIEIGRIFI
jgi:hypothetical protein